MRRFERGETVIRREVMRGEVWFAAPHICVQDTHDLIVTYLPGGAEFGFPQRGAFPVGRHPWESAGHTRWSGHGALHLHFPGVDHAIFIFWHGEQREWAGWYFNLQDAPRRTELGFDTLDHELDLWWGEGEPRWEWKDVDKFAETGPARYPRRMAEIQAEGDRIAALLDAGERWWDEGWRDWRPDPAWTVPALGTTWQDLPATIR